MSKLSKDKGKRFQSKNFEFALPKFYNNTVKRLPTNSIQYSIFTWSIFCTIPFSKLERHMKNSHHLNTSESKDSSPNSRAVLEDFFINSLREMYYAENVIAKEFSEIEAFITTPKLKGILKTHHDILLKHKIRLAKIFELQDTLIESKTCETFNALIEEGKNHLSIFSNDDANWEIALILVSQKLAHYKIASYGGLAHLAINLNYYKAATLLAISAQEEEEYIANNLNSMFDSFLSSHVKEYKN